MTNLKKIFLAAVMAFVIVLPQAQAATEDTHAAETEHAAELTATEAHAEESGDAAHAAEGAHAEQQADILGTLGINGKLLLAQLINFAIILAVLWKWVFTPVAKKLTERTEKIEKSLLDADRIGKEKLEFEKWKNEQMAHARQEAAGIVSQAQKDASAVKDATLNLTRQEQEKLVEQAKRQIQDEKAQALKDAKGELADLVTNATEKIIRQKLDGKKDEGLIKDLLKSI